MDIEFNLFGEKELMAVFEALPERMQKNVLSAAVRGGAAVISKAAKRNLKTNNSIRTGLLHKSITIKVKRYTSQGVIYAAVGANRSTVGTLPNGRRLVPANYAHLVEKGTRNSRAEPFMRPALDANRKRVFEQITARARKGMAREIRKLRKTTSI